MRKFISCLLLFSSIVFSACLSTPPAEEVVENKPEIKENQEIFIEDPNLESFIRKKINKPEGILLSSDVEKVEYLSTYGKEIITLNGIEQLSNLRSIELNNSKVSDISALIELENLTDIRIYDGNVSDISIFYEMPQLEKVDMSWNPIENLKPLGSLNRLKYLAIHNFGDDDIPLLELSSDMIETLYLSDCKLSRISFLRTLPNLKHLLLQNNPVIDYSVLEELPQMETLQLTSDKIVDIKFISHMPNLRELNLSEASISDLTPLADSSVERLYLWNTVASNFIPIGKMKSIRTLALTGPNLKDISFLKEARTLENLNIFRSQVKDLSTLLELENLISLKIGMMSINDDSRNRVIPELKKRGVDVGN